MLPIHSAFVVPARFDPCWLQEEVLLQHRGMLDRRLEFSRHLLSVEQIFDVEVDEDVLQQLGRAEDSM